MTKPFLSIGADHGGFELKNAVLEHLRTKGYEVHDRGTDSTESVDYPDFAQAVASDVVQGRAQLGIVICTSGIGIAIAANKVPGIRAAVVHNEDAALFSRMHNNANVIAFGQKYITAYMACRCLDIFLQTDFDGGERHARRVGKLEKFTNPS